ncbi:MAG: hypothetical protein RIR11_1246 [Bacteroidota bacterium]|jgi:acyl-CoA thioester hydrolase
MASFLVQHITINKNHIDELQHVNNLVYLQFALDLAGAHWQSVVPTAFPIHYAWMIRRHEIDYLHQGFLGDQLELKTWVGKPTNVTWERHTTIIRPADGKILVQLTSTWMLMDTVRQRPVRLDESILKIFAD